MKMVKRVFLIVIVGILVVSCGSYRKIQKSQDPELKYNAAINYFQDGKYTKAASLFDDLSTYYRGTRKAQEILYMLAESYVGQKDYYSAVEHYKIYVKNFPQGDYIRECTYMKGYCNYLLSPDARLDQTYTHEAISAFEDFVAAFPNSDKVPEAYGYIDELNEKYGLEMSEELLQMDVEMCSTIEETVSYSKVVVGPIPLSSDRKNVSTPFSKVKLSLEDFAKIASLSAQEYLEFLVQKFSY